MTELIQENTKANLSKIIDSHTKFGWKAKLSLKFIDRGDKTVLKEKWQKGPLAIQRPLYPEGEVCHCYVLHPPGGVVGGDSLHLNVKAKQGAKVLLTTPGATKFYRSDKKYARQLQHFTVDDQSRLEWLPQENIFFADAHVRFDTQIHLHKFAQFLGWELHCFGRIAPKEGFESGHLLGKTEIFIENQLILNEGLNINPDYNSLKNINMINFSMLGTFYLSIDDEEFYHLVQQLLNQLQQECNLGELLITATQLNGLIVIRALGNWSEIMLNAFEQVRKLARQHWTNAQPQSPRIWAT